MANSVTVSNTARSRSGSQFQGFFSDTWAVTATATFDTGITAAAEATFDLTVPGVALGDMIIGIAPTGADPEENIFFHSAFVTAANTVSVAISNVSGSTDTPAITGYKILIGRPNW